jgi:hypothetical protein
MKIFLDAGAIRALITIPINQKRTADHDIHGGSCLGQIVRVKVSSISDEASLRAKFTEPGRGSRRVGEIPGSKNPYQVAPKPRHGRVESAFGIRRVAELGTGMLGE